MMNIEKVIPAASKALIASINAESIKTVFVAALPVAVEAWYMPHLPKELKKEVLDPLTKKCSYSELYAANRYNALPEIVACFEYRYCQDGKIYPIAFTAKATRDGVTISAVYNPITEVSEEFTGQGCSYTKID